MKSDLITIPRIEYDFLLKKSGIKEVEITPAVKRALNRARKNLAQGKFLTLNELKRKLGLKSR